MFKGTRAGLREDFETIYKLISRPAVVKYRQAVRKKAGQAS
ncbi:hypothetical protein [Deinococcus sp. QL22]|nr:hypothetical protein [Deinococcus sp. QL22]